MSCRSPNKQLVGHKKHKSMHIIYGFSVSITWTNERKLNFRWLPYFRSTNLQGGNQCNHYQTHASQCLLTKYISHCISLKKIFRLYLITDFENA